MFATDFVKEACAVRICKFTQVQDYCHINQILDLYHSLSSHGSFLLSDDLPKVMEAATRKYIKTAILVEVGDERDHFCSLEDRLHGDRQ